MLKESDHNLDKFGIGAMAAIFVSLLVPTFLLPFWDTTEARYAEVARKMVETGDWVMPQAGYGVPFWGKPPLSFWGSSSFISLFGESEWAVRFPSILFTLATLWVMFKLTESIFTRQVRIIAAIVLSSGILFYVSSIAVMTEASLCLCVTGASLALLRWLHLKDEKALYLCCFFAGLGMLAKGPIVTVFLGMTFVFLCILNRTNYFKFTLKQLSIGIGIYVLVWLPWYVIAEIQSPGFINYFIIGEHISRFLVPGWKGDLYGVAHNHPRGTIWLYLIADLLPWMLVLLVFLFKSERQRCAFKLIPTSLTNRFLILWMLIPIVFFTFAGNIIPTYAIFSLPPFALLLAQYFSKLPTRKIKPLLTIGMSIVPLLIVSIAILNQVAPNKLNLKHSHKGIVEQYKAARQNPQQALYYIDKKFFSAEYYTQGKVRVVSMDELKQVNEVPFYLVLKKSQSGPERFQYHEVYSDGEYVLYQVSLKEE